MQYRNINNSPRHTCPNFLLVRLTLLMKERIIAATAGQYTTLRFILKLFCHNLLKHIIFLYFFSMDNLLHKRGLEISASIGKARKLARIEAGTELIHPFVKFKGGKTKNSDEGTMNYFLSYLTHIGSTCCRSKRRMTKCTCMIDLVENQPMLLAAGISLCSYGEQCKEIQRAFIMEWERNAVQRSTVHNRNKTRASSKGAYKGKKNIPFICFFWCI